MIYLSRNLDAVPATGVEAEVHRLLAAGELSQVLWVVPSAARATFLERKLVRASAGKAVTNPPISTISSLTSALLSTAEPALRVITDAESGVFIEQSIRELFAEGDLKYFEERAFEGSIAHAFPLPQGTFEMVLNTIRSMKEHGVYVHDLKREVTESIKRNGESTEVLRARDIAAIYDRYEQHLTDRFTDTYGQLQRLNFRYEENAFRSREEAAQLAQRDIAQCYPQVRRIFVEGFYRIEQPALRLLLSLADIPEVDVVFGFDIEHTNHTLFAGLESTLSQLRAVGFEELDRKNASELARALFNDDNKIRSQVRTTIFSARTKVEEVEQVARSIKHLIDSGDVVKEDLSRIAVTCAQPLDYTELFRDTFRRFDIPVNITDRYKLEASPLMSGVIALLEIAARGLRRRDVIRTLTSPYFVFANARGRPIDAPNLLQVITEFKVTGDVGSWQRYLEQQSKELETELTENGLDDEFEIREIRLKIAMVLRALQDLNDLVTMLAPFQRQLKPWRFKHHLHELFARLRFGDQLLDANRATIASGTLELDTRGYRSFIKLLEDLDALYALMGVQDAELPVTFYLERLRTASLWTRYNPRFRNGHVYVASMEQIQGLEFDHVYVVGMSDGILPSAYEPQVFLMDALQKGAERQLQEEKLLFYSALSTASKGLCLSYPECSVSGVELTPSTFLSAVRSVSSEILSIAEDIGTSICSYDDLDHAAGEYLRLKQSASLSLALESTHADINSTAARTLLDFAPHAVSMQEERRQAAPTEYRGRLDTRQLNEIENQELLRHRERVWSISQLERYAACPFSFFVENVLGLSQSIELEEGLVAREQGSFLHSVLRELFSNRRDRGEKPLQDLSEQELEPAFTEARSIAMRRLQEIDTRHPFWQLDTDRMLSEHGTDGVLERFIRKEQTLGGYSPRAQFFEASFGGHTGSKKEADWQIVHPDPIEVGGIKLRGKIDRIDVGVDGFTIIDYKTGKRTKKRKDIDRGTSLQLPLYLRVAEDLLRTYFDDLKGVAALYHKLMDEGSKRELGLAVKSFMNTHFEPFRGNGLVADQEELQALIDETIRKTRDYVDGVSQGDFGLTAKDLTNESCTYCSYYHSCRVKEAMDLNVLQDPVLPGVKG